MTHTNHVPTKKCMNRNEMREQKIMTKQTVHEMHIIVREAVVQSQSILLSGVGWFRFKIFPNVIFR